MHSSSFHVKKVAFRPCRLGWILLAMLGLLWPNPAAAAGNEAFAYGVRIDPAGGFAEVALDISADLGIGWLAMPVDWAMLRPTETSPEQFGQLDVLLSRAAAQQTPVLISITNAPSWAMGDQGPLPGRVADLISQLTARYPAVAAVELFPGANTHTGWGTTPDPVAYAKLFRRVMDRLSLEAPHIRLVAAGLRPPDRAAAAGDMDDVAYLHSLYQAGGRDWISTISLQFVKTTGAPIASPYQAEPQVLRRYEIIRQVMLEHGHRNGTMWITGFSWPTGPGTTGDPIIGDREQQAQWLHEAYNLFNSQLYIEVAFFDGLNPSSSSVNQATSTSLILPSGELHPGLSNLQQLTSFGRGVTGEERRIPGKSRWIEKAHLKLASSTS